MNFAARWMMVLSLGVGAVAVAWAAPVSVGQDAFSGSTTQVNFNGVADLAPVNNQYGAQGVVFGGALVGMDNPGDTGLFNGSNIASNWDYSPGRGLLGSSWTASFGQLQSRVGFFASTNPGDNGTIAAYRDGLFLGSLYYVNPGDSYNALFIGFEELGGFDQIIVTIENNVNGFFAMDDFRFDHAGLQVPEPGSFALLLLAASGLVAVRRRH